MRLLKDVTVRYSTRFLLPGLVLLSLQCRSAQSEMNQEKSTANTNDLHEMQLTKAKKGHFLNQRQAFSADDQYLVFDNRNDETKIGENASIEMVKIADGSVQTIYKLENQTRFGPGVGAVSFNPSGQQVMFIHGLNNTDASNPYGITRRFAMQLDLNDTKNTSPVESRDVEAPFTVGALRGGSHAHAYSKDGKWVSYTYNDRVLELSSATNPQVKDLRTVGVFLLNDPVSLNGEANAENFEGSAFSFLLAEVTDKPVPGSDQIMKAYEEGWVGDEGYRNASNQKQNRAVAFLGDVLTSKGLKLTEVFIVDIPEDIAALKASILPGDDITLPSVPNGVHQRRLTYTQDNIYPGVQGPRQWLRSSPDGTAIYFPMKNSIGLVQVAAVSPVDGKTKFITSNKFSLDTSFSISADGKYIAYGAEECIYISKVKNGETKKVLPAPDHSMSHLSNLNWSNSGYIVAYNRKVTQGEEAFYQIFVLDLSKYLF